MHNFKGRSRDFLTIGHGFFSFGTGTLSRCPISHGSHSCAFMAARYVNGFEDRRLLRRKKHRSLRAVRLRQYVSTPRQQILKLQSDTTQMARVSRKLLVTLLIVVSSVASADADHIALIPLENTELATIAAFTVTRRMAIEIRPSRGPLKVDAKQFISTGSIENFILDVGLASVSQAGTTLGVRASLH